MPSPAVLPSASFSVSITRSSATPRPPRCWPSPPESARNSWVRKCSGKRASATSTLPNFRPPTVCHSPIDDQPSPSADAPPPGRAWNRCQIKVFPVRGFSPWIAIRKRRPQPARRNAAFWLLPDCFSDGDQIIQICAADPPPRPCFGTAFVPATPPRTFPPRSWSIRRRPQPARSNVT